MCDEEVAKSDGYVTFRVQVCIFGDGCVLVGPSRGDASDGMTTTTTCFDGHVC